jgi:dTDP-4-amino-4,6-dideoxygalactose transaminase
MCEKAGKSVISLPVHEFVTKENLDKVIYHVKSFYGE